MRILHACQFYPPSVGGAQEVVRQVSERLAARGHEVTVATTGLPQRTNRTLNGVHIREFDVRGNAAGGMRGAVAEYRRFATQDRFDVVMSYAAQQWTTDALLDIAEQIPAARVLVPCGFSGLYRRRFRRYFARLPEQLKQWDALVFHGNNYRDIEFVRAAGLNHSWVIPNGADEREFADGSGRGARFRDRHLIARDVPMLLTVGSHNGQKGHAAVLRTFDRLTRDTVLVLIGNPAGHRGCEAACRRRAGLLTRRGGGSRRVLLLDPSRPEVVDAYCAADLFICASTIECSPLVLYEAAAAGVPAVSVPVGNAQEILENTGGGVTITAELRSNGYTKADPRVLAAEVTALLDQPDRRRQMGDQARATWARHYTWEAIAGQYERLYEQMVAARRT